MIFKRLTFISCVISIILSSCDYSEVKKNPVLTTGKIVSYDKEYRSYNFYPKFEYYVDSVLYTGSYSGFISLNYWEDFKGKNFPVIYSKRKPSVGIMLIFPDDFERFDLGNYPDSLQWVEKMRD